MEHESLEVDVTDQRDYMGAEEEKPRSKDCVCWLSDTYLCIILDLHASLPLAPVSGELLSSINFSFYSVSHSYLFLVTSQLEARLSLHV